MRRKTPDAPLGLTGVGMCGVEVKVLPPLTCFTHPSNILLTPPAPKYSTYPSNILRTLSNILRSPSKILWRRELGGGREQPEVGARSRRRSHSRLHHTAAACTLKTQKHWHASKFMYTRERESKHMSLRASTHTGALALACERASKMCTTMDESNG